MPPRRIGAGGTARALVLTRPQDMPEEWYALWESLITDMQRESEALPMNTLMTLMIERIATLYVQTRRQEDGRTADWEDIRGLQRLWLSICTEFNTQLHRNSQTPEQRFVATFKAALSSAVTEAGPDATVRELMPILASHLREFGI